VDRLQLIQGGLNDGRITTERPLAEIYGRLMEKDIVIIKGVFPAEEALRLRDLTFAWGRAQSAVAPKDFYQRSKVNGFYQQQGVSKIQKTLHYYRTHNLNNYDDLNSPELKGLLSRFFTPLRDFYNGLTGNQADFTGSDKIIHPEIIHYPSGGGFFAKHFHALDPQRVGVIVSLSRRGEDYQTGGTGFEVEGETVETEGHHDVGDIALFRYDLGHWVSPCDLEEAMNRESPKGRWTLILPYY
jgi:hypothetical protein